MKFLILEDDPERIIWFSNNIYPHRIMFCDTAKDAIEKLQSENFDVIFLDHDLCDEHYSYVGVPLDADFKNYCKENLDATTGMAVCKFLAENPDRSPTAQIVIHTMNTVAQTRMVDALASNSKTKAQGLYSRNNVTVAPFDYLKRKGLRLYDYVT